MGPTGTGCSDWTENNPTATGFQHRLRTGSDNLPIPKPKIVEARETFPGLQRTGAFRELLWSLPRAAVTEGDLERFAGAHRLSEQSDGSFEGPPSHRVGERYPRGS
jgi:hypothetical protein